MKATGIVRRIDDLGRVVIPKEIRRTMRIREGDPLEIYTDKEGGVIFKKYSLLGGVTEFAGQLCETLWRTSGHVCVITDRDSCIASAGAPKKELLDRQVSDRVEQLMENRQIFPANAQEQPIPLCADGEKYRVLTGAPILSEGDVLGSVLLVGGEDDGQVGEVEVKLVQAVAGFLGRHMES